MSKYVPPLTSKIIPDAVTIFQNIAAKINISELLLKLSSNTEVVFTDEELVYILSHADLLAERNVPLLPCPVGAPTGNECTLYCIVL